MGGGFHRYVRALAIFGVLAAAALSARIAAAQQCTNYPNYLHWVGELQVGGHATAVAATGNTALIANDTGGLRVVDVSEPTMPREVGSLPEINDCLWLAAEGNLACAARASKRIAFIDISDPAHPAVVCDTITFETPYCVALDAPYAYVADYMTGLLVYDVSNPVHPRMISISATPGYTYGVCVDGNKAYVADGATGLIIFDVSDPAHPVMLGTRRTNGTAWFVQSSGNTVLVGDRSQQLHSVDVSNPAHPRILASLDTPGTLWGLALTSTNAIIADGDNGLWVANVADPNYILPTGGLYVGGTANAVAVVGEYVFVAVGQAGLQIARFSGLGPVNPLATTACPSQAESVSALHGVACIASGTAGLMVVDIVNPSQPIPAWLFRVPYASAVECRGWHAYLTDEVSATLSVVNVSEPTSPWIETSISIPGPALDVVLSGNEAFVAAGNYGMQVVDVSDFLSLQLLGSVRTGFVSHVAVGGDYAYMAGIDSLRVADISEPSDPRLIGRVGLPASATGIATNETQVFVVASHAGLQIFDVSSPAEPRFVKSFACRGTAMGVDVAGDYVYFVDQLALGAGLHVIDISDPDNPQLAGRANMPEGGAAVCVYGSQVYVPGPVSATGLWIFPAQCGGTTPALATEVEASAAPAGIRVRWNSPPEEFREFVLERAAGRDPAADTYRLIATLPADDAISGDGWREFVDTDVIPGEWYCYRILGRSIAGDETELGSIAARAGSTLHPVLFAPQPSVSSGSFALRFTLPREAPVRLDVCDITGRRLCVLRDETIARGEHLIEWDGRDSGGRLLPGGAYLLRLAVGPTEYAQRALIVR